MHGRYGGRRRHSALRTASLLAAVSAVVLAVGALWGRTGLIVGLVVCLAINGFTCIRLDTIALRAMHARPVGETEQPEMYSVVRELSSAARLPMPRLYVSPTMAPNAFATGRDPRHAALCCTEGLLRILDERELRGVLGHELAHIRNRDILISSVAAALATAVIFLAEFVWLLPGGGDEDGGPGPLGLLFLAVLGPLGAMVVQVAVSRSREYRADVTAAQLTGDPLALASALKKLEIGTRVLPLRPEPELVATGHLMIANPFPGGGFSRLFATHPPLAERIRRLEVLGGALPRH